MYKQRLETKASGKREILKKEMVGYLRSNVQVEKATLYLTTKRMLLETQESGKRSLGMIGSWFRRGSSSGEVVFELDFSHIKFLHQGHYGMEKNVMEITDSQSNTYRVIVKNFSEWANLLGQYGLW